MRLLYAKSNKLLRTFSHCSTDVKIIPYFKVIAQHCIVLICRMITKNQHLIMFTEKYLPKGSSASTLYANHNICNFEKKNTFGFMQRLEQSTKTIINTLYQSWIVRFDICNSWIK